MSDFKPFIAKVASGSALTFDEARAAFDIVMSGEATPAQIGGFLMAMRVRGETVEEISGAVATMRAKMLPVEAPADAIDIVGTGGDVSGSYNISTCAAFVLAGAGLLDGRKGTTHRRRGQRRQARQPGPVVQVRRRRHSVGAGY